MFDKSRYLTKGVQTEIPFELRLFMWACIENMPSPKDYLQVFRLTVSDGNQMITHEQEQPEYKKDYVLNLREPITQKIYVIDDGDYSTMLLAEEY